ncbi:ergothioneine biosynthesis glutamate--cysteine ligase EgtA [Nocardia callitridis]|uniref:Glutamate--cysteine ligase EgtA n=1 Tax=Nocardia callitridis TaxID=648753 RepID=A0ABP9KJ03_9NOCA
MAAALAQWNTTVTHDTDVCSTRSAAAAYLEQACFALAPPTRIGVELEWLTVLGPPGSTYGHRPRSGVLAAALGDYAPRSIAPDSPQHALPGGSGVTVEPGGQVELSSVPCDDVDRLCEHLHADTAMLTDMLATKGVRLVARAADDRRRPERILSAPRYRTMERAFAEIGPFGAVMMCNTAATQISVDAGADRAEVTARWRALHDVGPALLAAFACSPSACGVPPGHWASQRMRAWFQLDPARTRPPAPHGADPITAYAHWALAVPLLCVRPTTESTAEWDAPDATFADWIAGALDDEIGRPPTRADLDYHLTTLFPPVRATGHLEIRYLDAQPDNSWSTPLHTFEALLPTPESLAAATTLGAPLADAWDEAARSGLAEPQLRTVAADLLDLAATTASNPAVAQELDAAARRCRRGQAPHES